MKFSSKASKLLSRKNLYSLILSRANYVSNGQSVLCIGASGGITTILRECAISNNWYFSTLDINSSLEPDLCLDICVDKLQPEKYDVVFACEVFEHLYDPFSAIENIYSSLKPGGLLIGSTPFAMPIHEAPCDFYRYTEYGLKHMLKSFSSVDIIARGNYYEAIDAIWARSIHCSTSKSRYVVSNFLVLMAYFIKRPISRMLYYVNPLGGWHIGYVFSGYKYPAPSERCV